MAPRQPALSIPASKKPLDEQIGAPFGPNPAFGVRLTASQATKKKAADAIKAQKKADKLTADAIFAGRQDANVKKAIVGRVGAQAGLPDPAHPFAGAEAAQAAKTAGPRLPLRSSPARDTSIPNLTEQSALARERAQLRAGGLTTHGDAAPTRPVQPGQAVPRPQTAAERALAALDSSRQYTFADRHQLPSELSKPAVSLSDSDVQSILHGQFQAAADRTGAPILNAQNAKRTPFVYTPPDNYNGKGGQVDFGALLSGAKDEAAKHLPHTITGGFSPKNIAYDAINSATLGLTEELNQAGRAGSAIASKSQALRAGPQGLDPGTVIPTDWLAKQYKQTVNAEAGAADNGKAPPRTMTMAEIEQKFGKFALGAQTREALAPLIKANGYSLADAPTWSDQEYLARAYNKKDYTAMGFVRNLAANSGQLASLLATPSMLGSVAAQSVEQRSATPLARFGAEMAKGFIAPAPFIGDRPWLENLYDKPVDTALTVAPVAKWAGLRVGRLPLAAGRAPLLSATREITLPTVKGAVDLGHLPAGSERVTVSASQHPLMRGIQHVGDKILERGVPQEGTPLERLAPRLVGRAGDAMESHINRRTLEGHHAQARLEKGHAPALVLREYMDAIREHPLFRDAMRHVKPGARAQKIEATLVTHGAGSKSEALAAAADHAANEYDAHAAQFEANAKAVETSDPKTAQEFRLEAQKTRETAAAQRDKAQWHRDNPIDIHIPEADAYTQRVVDSMRAASRASGQILKSQGLVDDKGLLYGDWQYRVDTILRTEPPGSPAYELAAKVKETRAAHIKARAAFHGMGPNEAAQLPASADIHSPPLAHAIRANADARDLLTKIDAQIATHSAGDQALGGANPVDLAWSEGIDRHVSERVANDVNQAVQGYRTMKAEGSKSQVVRLGQEIDKLKADELAAHHGSAGVRLKVLRQRLHVAETKGTADFKIQKIKNEIETALNEVANGPKPSAELMRKQRQLARAQIEAKIAMPAAEQIKRTMYKRLDQWGVHPTPRQKEALFAVVDKRIRDNTDLFGARAEAQDMEASSNKAFSDATQGKNIEDAHAVEQTGQAYHEALTALVDHQSPLGHDPFHLHMKRPGDQYGLQPTRVSADSQWAEANYTRDMHLSIAKDLDSLQRKTVQARMFELMSEDPMVIRHPAENSEIPPGWLAADKQTWDNLSSIAKSGDAKTKLLEEWSKQGSGSQAGGRVTHAKGDQILITRHMKDFVAGELKKGQVDNAAMNVLLKGTNIYRRWMLYTLPRTFVNNFVGNPLLAAVMAGAGIKTFVDSIRLLRHHPEAIPHILRGRGPLGSMAGKEGKLVGYQQFWRNANTFAEDLGNVMVYLVHAKKAFKTANDLKMWNHIDVMNTKFTSFMEKAAKGENPLAHDWAGKSAEAFGDMWKTMKHDQGLATLFLFHRWAAHMIHLTMWTLPVKYPGRALFLQQTAEMADQYRKEHGVFPDWAAGMVPFWSEIQKAGGLPQKVTWALSTGGINPFQTPSQSINLGTEGQAKYPAQTLLASNLTPPLRIALEQLVTGNRLDTGQKFRDYKGHDINGFSTDVALNSLIAATPLLNTLLSRAGMSDDSVQFPLLNALGVGAIHPRYNKAAQSDPSMQPPQARTGNFFNPRDLLLTLGSGLGANFRPIDAEGPRSLGSAQRTMTRQQQQQVKRRNLDIQQWAKESQMLWDRDHEAWKKSKYATGTP